MIAEKDILPQTDLSEAGKAVVLGAIAKHDYRCLEQFFENPLFYDTLQNARRQADTSTLNIVNATLQMIQQVVTLASLVILLLRFSLLLAVIVFAAAIPSSLSQSQYAERAFRAVTRRAPEVRLLNYLEQLLPAATRSKRSNCLAWASRCSSATKPYSPNSIWKSTPLPNGERSPGWAGGCYPTRPITAATRGSCCEPLPDRLPWVT